MSDVRQVWQTAFGDPSEVLQVRQADIGPPAEGEVLVEVHAAPVLPMDNLRVRGHYPLAQALPGVPGSVGVGRVLDGPSEWRGRWVCLPMRAGSWCTHTRVAVDGTLLLDEVGDPVQASLLRVNGLTAQALLSGLERNEWVLFNAANGGVGHFVSAIARRMGVRTAAVVRSTQAAARVDADVVVVDGPQLAARLRDAGMGEVHRALDGVGGEATARLGSALGDGGRVLHYGATSRAAPSIQVADSIFRGVLLQGFWLYRLDAMRGVGETRRLMNRLIELELAPRQVATVGLEDAAAALSATGRVVITPQLGAS